MFNDNSMMNGDGFHLRLWEIDSIFNIVNKSNNETSLNMSKNHQSKLFSPNLIELWLNDDTTKKKKPHIIKHNQ